MLALNLNLKTTMRKFLVFLFSVVVFTAQAQYEVYDNVDEDDDRNSSEFDLQDRLYLNISNSYFVDFINSPLTTAYITNANVPGPGDTVTTFRQDPIAAKTVYQSFFTIGFEPRLNVIEMKDNLALAVSAPIAIGFGNAFPGESAAGATGLGHIQIPLMVKLYSGAASTFRAEDDFGISAGAGFEMNKLALFKFASTEQEQELNKAWIMPSVSLGVHFYRGYSPMEVNIKYGFGPIERQTLNGVGDVIFPELITRASSLKLSFVYMLGS